MKSSRILRKISPLQNSFVLDDMERIPIPVHFTRNAEKSPDRTALVDLDNKTYSYGELNIAANRLANQLLLLKGQREEPIAFLTGKEVASVIAILGIWKAGKLFAALDPDNPVERLKTILRDSKAEVIVTNLANFELANQLGSNRIAIINLDQIGPEIPSKNPPQLVSSKSLAAIQYTSGSSGIPKGALRDHASMSHQTAMSIRGYHFGPDDRILHPFSFSFGWGIHRLCIAFVPGGTLCLCDFASMTISEIARWLVDREISCAVMTATMFTEFLTSLPKDSFERFHNIRLISVGGEAFNPRDLDLWKERFSPHCILATSLSSTEAGVMSRLDYDFASDVNDNPRLLGYPEPGVELFILDELDKPVKSGETGRIAVRSGGVIRGYWGRPDLNKKLFVPHPLDSGEKILVTSDLGRLLPDGRLEFLGRGDAMLKIRGFRVEPGEIEAALMQHPAIRNAAVVGRNPPGSKGESALIAYVVTNTGEEIAPAQLREFLAKRLPDYMLPTYYVFLRDLPRNLNGKIDRKQLPDPDWNSSGIEYVSARTKTENYLVALWQSVLRKERIGADDNFFLLGGHSLAAFRIMAHIQEDYGIKLPLQVMMNFPTIRQLAKAVDGSKTVPKNESIMKLRVADGVPSLFIVPGAARTSMGFTKVASNIDAPIGIYGLEYPGMDGYLEPIDHTETLASFFVEQIKSVQSEGPYFLGGQCFGGVIAFEIARQLSRQGKEIGLVILLDSSPPGMKDNELDSRGIRYYLGRMITLLTPGNRGRLVPFIQSRMRSTRLFKRKRRGGLSVVSRNKAMQPAWIANPLDEQSIRVVSALSRARKGYIPQPLSGRGLALLSSLAQGTAREAWWRSLFVELECHYVPNTSHQNFFSAEHSQQEIGRIIANAIKLSLE
jgi:amino acid adenylation domain-containing protein